jgi:hypothetical protein
MEKEGAGVFIDFFFFIYDPQSRHGTSLIQPSRW